MSYRVYTVESQRHGLESRLRHLVAKWFWAGCWPFLNLGFLLCKNEWFYLPLIFWELNVGLLKLLWASLVAQVVKYPPVMWETWVLSLGWEDTLEKGMATHSSILAWRIPMDRGAWRAAVHGVPSVRHDWAAEHGTAPLVETPAVLSWPEVFSSWILSLHSRLTWPTER